MSETMTVAPVVKSVHVKCGVANAFEVFTRGIGSWWPLDELALAPGEVKEVVWEEREGGEVYEVSNSGERSHWATVLEWEPPSRLVLAWNILDRGDVTEVEVRFLAAHGRTRVELEHRGWENVELDAPTKRGDYDVGWDFVLGEYVDRTG